MKALKHGNVYSMETLEEGSQQRSAKPAEAIDEIQISDSTNKTNEIDTSMLLELKENLISFQKGNVYVFVWSLADMLSMSPKMITHYLDTNKKIRPVKLKRQYFAAKRQATINEKVQKLLEASFIRETQI